MTRVTLTVTDQPLLEQKTQGYALFLPQDFSFDQQLKDIEKKFIPHLSQLMMSCNFTGKRGESFVIPALIKSEIHYLICVGLGHKTEGLIDIEQFRRAVGTAIRELSRVKADSISVVLPDAKLFNVAPEYLAQQCTTIASMAWYHFDEFFTDESRKTKNKLSLAIVTHDHTISAMREGCERGLIYSRAVNSARRWVDLPPDFMGPLHLSEQAKEIAKKHGFKLTIFGEKEVNQMGMGGLSAVARGSDRDCQLVIMEYKTKKKNAQTIAFVGKGITFDSGGLSIKPAESMETMKEDMAGAAAVISAMDAFGDLHPDVNIIAVTPLAENLPSGKAIKPGDIVTFYNGKTAEIRNTDAEGRLILADALSYAVKHYKLDAIVDIATLTGACAYALGPFYTGLMSRHELLVKNLFGAAQLSGDHLWRLPLDDDYKPAIKSEVADIKNTGSPKYRAGTITAALFLENFVNSVPWAHLDIAGTAFDVPDISYYRTGATGVGVRLLIDLALNWPL